MRCGRWRIHQESRLSQVTFSAPLTSLAQGKEINYRGASGEVDFDDHGDVVTPIEVWKIDDHGMIVTERLEDV